MPQQAPIILSTWNFGLQANEQGWAVLNNDGTALDAAEMAARTAEDDPEVTSVGYGGYPNEEGVVQLDAAVIDGRTGQMGSVGALEDIKNPSSVARKVMEEDKHIYLMGKGAKTFALKHGFQPENLFTPQSLRWYANRLESRGQDSDDGHDTIGVLVLDQQGHLAVVCTTSGLAMKWAGRVGDSPMIGAGLYLDQRVGAAVATGEGERAIEVCGTFAIVELMRNGDSPQTACEKVIKRVVDWNQPDIDFQLGFLALSPEGEPGAAGMQSGFEYAQYANGTNELLPARIHGKDFE